MSALRLGSIVLLFHSSSPGNASAAWAGRSCPEHSTSPRHAQASASPIPAARAGESSSPQFAESQYTCRSPWNVGERGVSELHALKRTPDLTPRAETRRTQAQISAGVRMSGPVHRTAAEKWPFQPLKVGTPSQNGWRKEHLAALDPPAERFCDPSVPNSCRSPVKRDPLVKPHLQP